MNLIIPQYLYINSKINNVQLFHINDYNLGEWSANKMHGEGEFRWPDGKKYKGTYIEDKKEGYGVFDWSDGRKYLGEWKDGKQHGMGTVIDREGKESTQEWENGKKLTF